MKVMIGVDGSPCSRVALEFVQKARWPPDTQLLVVSSVGLPASALLATFAPVGLEMGSVLDRLTDYYQEIVSQAEKALQGAGLHVESSVLKGDPRETLIREASARHIELIVVGSHGRTGLERLILGSVASYLVAHAPCSVLVVRPPARAPQ